MWRRSSLSGLWALILALAAPAFAQAPAEPSAGPLGFFKASRPAQARAEAFALGVPTPENARALLRTLTEEPHAAGTDADYRTALFVRDRLKEWGWEVSIAEYHVLLNEPATAPQLSLSRPQVVALNLAEAPNGSDKDSASLDAFPAFHGYGVSGDAAGQVVYVNYGRPEDYVALDRMGVDVRGKIVLVRYGELFRGLKVRNAQKRGARGVLIYSDPGDDGYARGDVYPNGPYRPGSAIQRGSVQFLSLGPGDPSTPGGPSVKNAKRLPVDPEHGFPIDPAQVIEWEKASGLKREDYFATIPSLPISYDNARPILEALGGHNVPAEWQGGLPLAYHVGPGPAEVSMSVRVKYKVKPIWNVIATIKGAVEPDQWVLMGNHRDAWVYGAVDPSSGTAATLEACRAIGAAVKNGWKPRRTMVYASWDAEEYGLVGSTEWVDEHAEELDEKALMLLNVDSAVGGVELDLDGVPSLRDLMLDAAGAVTDVRSGKSLKDLWVEKRRSQWAANSPVELGGAIWTVPSDASASPAPAIEAPAARFSPQLNPLGSGSDYTAFLDHMGIPALDAGFAGRYGVYHSIFDNFYWMEKFCDPEFLTHAMAAKLYVAVVMRAAGADVAPLTFAPYGEALRDYVDDLRRVVERRARASARPEPIRENFAGLPELVNAVRAFSHEAEQLDVATSALAAAEKADPTRLTRANEELKRVERAFLSEEGLPGRPWFKHAIYAPGLTTGYACWPLPGVRQAILDNDAKLLATQLPALVKQIDAATVALKRASFAANDARKPDEPAPAQEPAKPKSTPADRPVQ